MDVLHQIKRLVVARAVEFTAKATDERQQDGLTVEHVLESIVNANAIKKTLRSTSTRRKTRGEKLYIIESPSYDGTWIYTKGTIRRVGDREVFYVLVSAKLSL